MVETLMIFGLGFLLAALLALLIIPAINARAERLVRRRLEALFPLSIDELTAEKDHLRAELAVKERRMERRVQEALASKHGDMEELGRRAVRIEELTSTLAQRDERIGVLEADLADTQARLAATEGDLAETRASLAATREALSALETAHRRSLDELATTRDTLEQTSTDLTETRTYLEEARERLIEREAAYADLDARHTAALTDIDTKRIQISDLETRLSTQTARGDEYERAHADRRTELAEERRRLAETTRDLVSERERGLVLEQRIRALEGERDGKVTEASGLLIMLNNLRSERDSLLAALDEQKAKVGAPEMRPGGSPAASDELAQGHETLLAERSALEAALAAARTDRARLEREVARLRGEGGGEALRAENAELRRRIDEVTDRILDVSRDQPPRQAAGA